MENLWVFLVSVVAISLSGVMAPGALTAATIASGSRSPNNGAKIAIGHGIVEFPLIAVLALGAGQLFKLTGVKISVGLIGGLVLIFLAIQLINTLRKGIDNNSNQKITNPIYTGIALTAANPYFLLWWATVGLGLIAAAQTFGLTILIIFAIVHWLCDLVWLWFLSAATYSGSKYFGPRAQLALVEICAVALFAFGIYFIADASSILLVGTT